MFQEKKYNEMVFDTGEQNGLELFNNFLNNLISYNLTSENDYNDIHIYQEESLIILQWNQVPFSKEWGGEFKFVDTDDDQLIVKQLYFPDGSYEFVTSREDEKNALDVWKKSHPTWRINSFGMWQTDTAAYTSFAEAEENHEEDEEEFSAEAGNDKE